MVICLERGADLHMAQLMPLPLTVSCKVQIGFTFLVPARPGSPGQSAVKWVCVCVMLSNPPSVFRQCWLALASDLCSELFMFIALEFINTEFFISDRMQAGSFSI